MQQDYLGLGIPLVSAYIDRLLYELSYSEGFEDATRCLDDMRAKFKDSKDLHGLGLYERRATVQLHNLDTKTAVKLLRSCAGL